MPHPDVSICHVAFLDGMVTMMEGARTPDERRLAATVIGLYGATQHTPEAIGYVNQLMLGVMERNDRVA